MGRKFKKLRRDRKSKLHNNAEVNTSSNGTNDKRQLFKDIVRENTDFEAYYKAQKICPENEWDEFIRILKTDLPTSFRITGCHKAEADSLLSVVESTFFKDLVNSVKNPRKLFSLPWYPQRYGWQLEITRNDIRRSEVYFRLHNFLIHETMGGYISRQEAVSMIPPLLLDIKSHHKVLDMCAAPGSKTAQLIEMLMSDNSTCPIPEGVVVANDIDNKRCYMLVHQAKRLNSPCAIITNHDASVMPNFYLTDSDGSKSIMKFDRILCDVPCVGDGTMRKNADIWVKWNTANGNNLHGVQIRVLKRGLEMLTVGGRLVYSTCSFNPIENEAVLHRLLTEAEDSVEIVDVSLDLPGLKYSPGMTHWYPASKDLTLYNSPDEVEEKWSTVVRPNMFPPSNENAAKFNLERCIRILPHYQNTGGFFVAVLKKVKLLPWEAPQKSTQSETNINLPPNFDQAINQLTVKNPPKKRKVFGYKEDPFVFFDGTESVWSSIRDFFELQKSDLLPSGLLCRCTVGKKKNIYFTSPLVKNIITTNSQNIKLINSGVKVFVRCHNSSEGCCFRMAQEGLQCISSLIGNKRRLEVSKQELIQILKHNDPSNAFSSSKLEDNTQKRISEMDSGSCVLELKDDKFVLALVGWRGMHTVRAYISLADSIHYLRLLGEDVSEFDKNKFKKEADVADLKEQEDIASETNGLNEQDFVTEANLVTEE